MDDRSWKWLALLSLVGLGGLAFLLLRRTNQLASPSPTTIYILNGRDTPTQVLAGHSEPLNTKRLEGILEKLAAKFEIPISNNLIQSYELPVLGSTTTAVRVCQALQTPFDVVLRVVGPPGSLAVFSTNTTDLDVTGAAIPVGNTLIVPAGSDHKLRLTPHQALFGKGTLAGVVASVNATETAVRSMV